MESTILYFKMFGGNVVAFKESKIGSETRHKKLNSKNHKTRGLRMAAIKWNQ